MCRERPNAAHYFATYLINSKTIKLHFELFNCEGKLMFLQRCHELPIEGICRFGFLSSALKALLRGRRDD